MNILVVTILIVAPLFVDEGHAAVIDPNNPDDVRILENHNVNITALQTERERRLKENQKAQNASTSRMNLGDPSNNQGSQFPDTHSINQK